MLRAKTSADYNCIDDGHGSEGGHQKQDGTERKTSQELPFCVTAADISDGAAVKILLRLSDLGNNGAGRSASGQHPVISETYE